MGDSSSLHDRDGNDIFAINSISFHPKNTYVSAGGDGVLSFWDKEARHRLAHFEQFKRSCPITDVKFNQMVRLCLTRVI
jgi:mRNA export factor